MAEDKKISQLNPAAAFTGAEKFELVQGGLNLAGTPEQMKTYIGGITREFDRAFASELLFDKNEIEGVLHTQTADITFTIAEAGNIEDEWSFYGQEILTDGVSQIFFEGFAHIQEPLTNGIVLDAGTYQFIFWYGNGKARVSVMSPSSEEANLSPLATPTNFAVVPGTDPETEADLSWDAVPNVSSYEIYRSATGGGGPWGSAIATPAAGATSYTDTGRTPNTTYHYRIRAMGDLVNFNNSNYTITAVTTEDSGDSTPPTMEHSIANGATGIPVNQVLILTFSEAIRKVGGAEITNANAGDVIAVKQTNGAGAVIPCTFVIDSGKMEIRVTPNVIWGDTQLVFVEASGIEDTNANAMVTDSFTFTTSDFTLMAGNYVLDGGLALDPIIEAVDGIWELKATIQNHPASGTRSFAQKYGTTNANRSLLVRSVEDALEFRYYNLSGGNTLSGRFISWPGVITSGEHTYEFRYKGNVDTNNGLDRVDLYKDGVLVTVGKALETLGVATWPFDIRANSEPLKLLGTSVGEVKDIIITANAGATTELDIPIVRTGLDVSGNNRHCTWI